MQVKLPKSHMLAVLCILTPFVEKSSNFFVILEEFCSFESHMFNRDSAGKNSPGILPITNMDTDWQI